ncbi:serine acetyltransferase [Clavibacter michiganensis]|nr:serine acetyltransferase [Clavibacter michiganensis]
MSASIPAELPSRIASRDDLRLFLKLDLLAHGHARWRPWDRLSKPTLHYQRALRRVEYWASRDDLVGRAAWVVARLRLAQLSVRTGLSVPPGVFAPGLSIAHYGSVVVNDKARVGPFCRIHSATTIGGARGAAPMLGAFVYVGPGAVVTGGVRVGDGVAIGANSVVTRDCASHATYGGAPARKISDRDSSSAMPEWIARIQPAVARHEES